MFSRVMCSVEVLNKHCDAMGLTSFLSNFVLHKEGAFVFGVNQGDVSPILFPVRLIGTSTEFERCFVELYKRLIVLVVANFWGFISGSLTGKLRLFILSLNLFFKLLHCQALLGSEILTAIVLFENLAITSISRVLLIVQQRRL